MAGLNKWSIIGGNSTAGVITQNGGLVGWGNPSFHQLGAIGNTTKDPTNLTLANGRTATGVLFGSTNTVVVCDDGSIQVAGYNAHGQLGTGNTTNVTGGFTTVSLANGKLGKKAIITGGGTGTAIVCTDGTVQFSGITTKLHTSLNSVTSFTVADRVASVSVADLACTNNGFILLTTDNKIYVHGQFQNSDQSVDITFTEKTLPAGRVPKQVFSKFHKCYVLCTNGEVYAIGATNIKSGWPTGMNILSSNLTLLPLPSGKLVKWLGAGSYHTIIITTDNLVYVTGGGDSGDMYNIGFLGMGTNYGPFASWAQITSLKAGRTPIAVDCTDENSYIIYDDGSVQGAGANSGRHVGDGTTTKRNVFTDIALVGGATVYSTTVTGLDSAPGAPTIGAVTPGNQQVSVAFTAPENNGGKPITRYNVVSSPGAIDVSGGLSPIVVTGLTNGTAYTFTVTATNSVGTSSASSQSASVTPRTVPGAPTAVSAVGANRQATVSFTPPVSTGGSVITGYTVTSSPGNIDVSGASSPLTVTGLTNGTAYTFTVKATNVAGDSTGATTSPVTPSVEVPDLNAGNISTSENDIVVAGSRTITAKKQAKSAGAVSYAPDAANKPSVTISSIPASVQDITVGVSAPDASGIAIVKIVAQAANGSLVTNFVETPLTVRVTLPGFTSNMVTIQTSATLGGSITDTIIAYKVGTNLYEFTTTHLTYFSASAYVPCFVAGTRILTAEGYKAVETLTADDLIRTADNRIVPFRMFKTHITATSSETAPYTIPANTFGRACPATEMTISPYHAIQSSPTTWQIPKYAAQMFRGITQAKTGQAITYYHLELPNYFKDNIVAEGTVVESYGNRQTAGMKTVYKLNEGRTGFTRMEKTKSAKKTA